MWQKRACRKMCNILLRSIPRCTCCQRTHTHTHTHTHTNTHTQTHHIGASQVCTEAWHTLSKTSLADLIGADGQTAQFVTGHPEQFCLGARENMRLGYRSGIFVLLSFSLSSTQLLSLSYHSLSPSNLHSTPFSLLSLPLSFERSMF
jgi:hypothetical protein